MFDKDYVSLENALKTLNILSFEEKIFLNKVKLMFNIANVLARYI